jgi:hypothetical protein
MEVNMGFFHKDPKPEEKSRQSDFDSPRTSQSNEDKRRSDREWERERARKGDLIFPNPRDRS